MLILAAIPLGNPADASARLKSTIESAVYVAAEDSRRFNRLCQDLGIRHNAKVISFFEGNENERLDGLIEILEAGHDLLVVTDAGMPGISDPGYRLAREAVTRNISISVLPGPSAVTTALLLSVFQQTHFVLMDFHHGLPVQGLLGLKLARRKCEPLLFSKPHIDFLTHSSI